jgi:hypothetical protein
MMTFVSFKGLAFTGYRVMGVNVSVGIGGKLEICEGDG